MKRRVKITYRDAVDIKKAFRNGTSVTDLATKYRVSRPYLYSIINKKDTTPKSVHVLTSDGENLTEVPGNLTERVVEAARNNVLQQNALLRQLVKTLL